MNKLFTKIAALALGATMAVGVGVAVASSGKEAAPVSAATIGTNLVQVTSLTSGNQYVIVGNNNGYALPTNPTVSSGKVAGTAIASVPADGSGYLWTFTKSGNYWLIGDGSKYIYHSNGGSSGTNLTYGTSTTIKWKLTYSTSSQNHWTFKGVNGTTENSRGMLVNGTNFGGYALSNESSYKYMNIYEVAASKTLSSITLGGTYDTEFTVGDTFNHTGMTVTAHYSDSSTATVTSSATWSSPDMSSAGQKTVTVSYTEGSTTKTANYTITVSAPTTPYITPAKNSTSGYTGLNETLSFTYGNLTSSLSVTSSNTSVVTVGTPSTSAGSGTVQLNFVGAGSTTVNFLDGSTQRASVNVSVTASTVTITGLPAEATCYSNGTLDLGTTITVTPTGSMSSDVSWESDDESIATVSSAGVVTPVALGTANITVTSDDYPSATMTCEVTVATAPQKYVIDGPDNDSASTGLTLANLKTYYPTTNMEVEWTAVGGSIYGSSTQAMRVGTGSATGSATLSLVNNASIYVTKIVVNVKNYGSDSSTFVVNGNVTTNTAKSGTSTATDYEFAFSSSDTTFTIQNVSKRIYVYRVDVYYSYKAAELSASPSTFDLAVSTSQNVTLTPKNFTPSSYSATVKSGSSLTASSVAFSGDIATVTAGITTGVTVLTITGTEGLRTASVDITVDVTQPRNLTALTITTASDATTFKVGETFDVGSLVITGTFDSAPTTVVYSKAQGNMALLTAIPEIGYEFLESDIGTITSAEFELTVGTGTKSVSYTISVIDKDYAAKLTTVTNLWDGQKVYFSNGTNAAFPEYTTGKNVISVDATIHETKGLDIAGTTAFAYTVGRVKVDDNVYYTFSFDEGGNTYYIKDAGTSSDNAINKTTDTTDETIYWTISAGTNSGQWHIVNKSNTIKPTLQVNGAYLSCYNNNQTDPYLFAVTPYDEQTVADAFVDRYLHMDEDTPGQCNTYYPILKPVWAAMADLEKAGVSGAAYERLQAWAAAHGEHLDSDMNLVADSRISPISIIGTKSDVNVVAIVVITSVISLTAIGGYFFLRKRKENI